MHHKRISVRKSTFRHQDPYLKEPSKVWWKEGGSLFKKSDSFLRKSNIQQMKTQNFKTIFEYPLLGNGTIPSLLMKG